MGNTLRSLFYMWFYLEESNITSPWLIKELLILAAGDDVVSLSEEWLARLTAAAVLSNTARTKKNDPLSLGQSVPYVTIGEFYDMDFCSKWSSSPDGTVENWHFCRDVSKVLSTKRYYTGKTAEILQCPRLHAEAKLSGFKSEHVSRLVEDIMQVQVDSHA